MSNELNRIDGPEDSEKPERRRTPLALIIALIAVCAMLGAFGVYASGVLNSDNPTEEPPTDEPVSIDTATFTPVPTDEPTAPPTDEPTDTPTPTGEPTDEPTDAPTDTPTPTATTPPPPRPQCVCGDGVCCAEETASCPADCGGGCTGPCCDNGGLQWQGEVCVCPGVVDIVTYCQDGSKTDQLTDRTCQPTQDCTPACVPDGTITCTCGYTPIYPNSLETCYDSCGKVISSTLLWGCP